MVERDCGTCYSFITRRVCAGCVSFLDQIFVDFENAICLNVIVVYGCSKANEYLQVRFVCCSIIYLE